MSACLLSAAAALAQPVDEISRLFSEGNRAYEQGRYEEAAQHYRQIVQYGIRNADVFYNLGNACYKLDQLGQSILHYEKALRLKPADAEIRENLDFVSALRVDQLEEPQIPFWWKALLRIHHLLTLNTQLGLMTLLWLVANAGLALRLLRRDRQSRALGGWALALALLVLVPGAVSAGIKIQRLSVQEAIVVIGKADLLSGPGEGNATLVSVHEGLKVEIRNRTSGWVQVVLPNGWNGWVPESAVEII